jgi:hypothetical protein
LAITLARKFQRWQVVKIPVHWKHGPVQFRWILDSV